MARREARVFCRSDEPLRPQQVIVEKLTIRKTPASLLEKDVELRVPQRSPTRQADLKTAGAHLPRAVDALDDRRQGEGDQPHHALHPFTARLLEKHARDLIELPLRH